MGTLGAHACLFAWRGNCLWLGAVCARGAVLKKTSGSCHRQTASRLALSSHVSWAPQSTGPTGHMCTHVSREEALEGAE